MSATSDRLVYSVSQLNREVRDLLEHQFGVIWVEGELSNLARPSSGHWYFSLKDRKAQVRCAMFRNANGRVKFRPGDGQQVLIRGRLGLYEPRGDYQLIADHMEPAGEGALRLAFEQLKAKLDAEGLFDPAGKQAIPRFPRAIGVISSATGAAVRDILSVLSRRSPGLPVILYPVPVQGADAAPAICRMLGIAAGRAEVDVLIIARGGGSLEDLQAFNEESVARAIAACPLPVVSGVGHEIDFTITDFCADLRAPTPSAAAELVGPDLAALRREFARAGARLGQRMQQRLATEQRHLEYLRRRLVHPGRRLQQLSQRLDNLEIGLRRAMDDHLRARNARLQGLLAGLLRHSPRNRIALLGQHNAALAGRLRRAVLETLQHRRGRLAELQRALVAVSPEATLGRGYAIVTDPADGRILRSTKALAPGTTLATRLADGSFHSVVTAAEDGE